MYADNPHISLRPSESGTCAAASERARSANLLQRTSVAPFERGKGNGMPVETLLACVLGIIGALLTMLIGLVVYVFLSLKGEVRNVASEVNELSRNRAKLVHKDDCRATAQRVHTRLDEFDATLQDLNGRMTRVETTLEMEHCS